jgi:phospholipid/cholesterol/gamma-HCH transport system substrate-binding protein
MIAGLLVMLFGEMPSFVDRKYTIYIRFPQAPGVQVDTPVNKSGILIGRVTRVTLLDTDSSVVVSAQIDSERKLRSNEICRIKSGILGDASLEFIQSRNAQASPIAVYRDGDYLDGMVANDPQSVMESASTALQTIVNLESEVRTALDSIQVAGQQVGAVAEGMNSLVANNSEQFQRILVKGEKAMDRLDLAFTAVDRFLNDDNIKRNLDETISQFPDLVTDASDVLAEMKDTITTIREAVEPMKETFGKVGNTVDNITGSVDSFAKTFEKITATVDDVSGSFDSFKDLGPKLDEIAENINNTVKGLGPRFDEITGNLNDVVKDIGPRLDELTGSLTGVVEKANRNLENLEGLTGPLGERGESYAASLDSGLAQIDTVLNNLVAFSDAMNSQDGTIGKLVYSTELYDQINEGVARINRVAANTEDITQQVGPMLDGLKPIIYDFRVFADKLARDPGRIGLKGALDRRQSGIKR